MKSITDDDALWLHCEQQDPLSFWWKGETAGSGEKFGGMVSRSDYNTMRESVQRKYYCSWGYSNMFLFKARRRYRQQICNIIDWTKCYRTKKINCLLVGDTGELMVLSIPYRYSMYHFFFVGWCAVSWELRSWQLQLSVM